jgi:uncharacterized protein (DUF1778 family)
MTDEEKRRLDEAAKSLGMSVADFIRTAVNDYAERSRKRAKK